ncbi:MAG: DUF86 domain-containing protein [Dehalococcoidia bacterium]
MPSDDALLLDMLQWCREGRSLVADVTWDHFQTERAIQLAVVYVLQTIGEAARGISKATRNEHPEIPWDDIIGMRHRLVHEYGRVNLTIAWSTVRSNVPDLIVMLESVVTWENG